MEQFINRFTNVRSNFNHCSFLFNSTDDTNAIVYRQSTCHELFEY